MYKLQSDLAFQETYTSFQIVRVLSTMMRKIDNLSKRTEKTFKNHSEILSSLGMEVKSLSSVVYSPIASRESPIDNSTVILPPS